MTDLMKNILMWLVIGFVVLAVFSRYMPTTGQPEELRYSTFLNEVKASKVESVVFQGDTILGVRRDKTRFQVFNPETSNTALIGELRSSNVAIDGRKPAEPSFLVQLLLQLAPALLLI